MAMNSRASSDKRLSAIVGLECLKPARNGWLFILVLTFFASVEPSQSQTSTVSARSLAGVVITDRNEVVPDVSVVAEYSSGRQKTTTDTAGVFRLSVPSERVKLTVVGKYLVSEERTIGTASSANGLQLRVSYAIPALHEGLVISATALNPTIDQRNDNVYKNTLFSRDDQLFDTLAAGINTGQHEGGGKSLEIRRFGFNLDHGGVNGGLKVLVDDVQQNQGTQGHGQGYLGALKSLTPELVDDVDILNGPFSAEYGDFSGLGVVHIRLKESLLIF
jgi:TonB-dependent Receptor Plug Domain